MIRPANVVGFIDFHLIVIVKGPNVDRDKGFETQAGIARAQSYFPVFLQFLIIFFDHIAQLVDLLVEFCRETRFGFCGMTGTIPRMSGSCRRRFASKACQLANTRRINC